MDVCKEFLPLHGRQSLREATQHPRVIEAKKGHAAIRKAHIEPELQQLNHAVQRRLGEEPRNKRSLALFGQESVSMRLVLTGVQQPGPCRTKRRIRCAVEQGDAAGPAHQGFAKELLVHQAINQSVQLQVGPICPEALEALNDFHGSLSGDE